MRNVTVKLKRYIQTAKFGVVLNGGKHNVQTYAAFKEGDRFLVKAAENVYVVVEAKDVEILPTTMTRERAAGLAFAILDSFKEAGDIYNDYQADEEFTDKEYDEMLHWLRDLKTP